MTTRYAPAVGRPADAQEFVAHRPMLFGLAYRITGSAHDADDVLQEAYLRWAAADRADVAQPRRYLTRVVARLAIDHLRARQARRETYIGEWLPEPIATDTPPMQVVDTSDLSLAVLHLMEQLTPPQRAVYVLHTAFELPYAEIAAIVERTTEDCRQLHRRAEQALESGRARFSADRAGHDRLLSGFVAAARAGDLARLQNLLHDDVIAWSDGGGKAKSARNAIVGITKVARFFAGIHRRSDWLKTAPVQVNGAAGLLVAYHCTRHLLVIETAAGRIERIYLVANPDKLVQYAQMWP